MKCDCFKKQDEHTSPPYVVNVDQITLENPNFRTTIWTGKHLQMTVMCIPSCGEIGLEIHPDVDQFIRVEKGKAIAYIGSQKDMLTFQQNMCEGDAVFIPAGMWHNILNVQRQSLKVSVIYAPPNHPQGTVHRTKKEADMAEY